MNIRFAFVSHTPPDAWFTDLLNEVLTHHGVGSFFSAANLPHDVAVRSKVDVALGFADVLLVVVSRHSREGESVKSEIASFRSVHTKGRILALCIDSTRPEDVASALSQSKIIDFRNSLSSGFHELLPCLNREYLPNRRTNPRVERRDLSPSGLARRLRTGLWLAYTRHGDAGKYSPIEVCEKYGEKSDLQRAQEASKLVDWLTPAVGSFEFSCRTSSRVCPHGDVIGGAVSAVLAMVARTAASPSTSGLDRNEVTCAIYFVEAVAAVIDASYDIRFVDRRKSAVESTCNFGFSRGNVAEGARQAAR